MRILLKNIKNILKKIKHFIQYITYKKNLKKQFSFFTKNKIKLIKIHPRYLDKDLKKDLVFTKVFLNVKNLK